MVILLFQRKLNKRLERRISLMLETGSLRFSDSADENSSSRMVKTLVLSFDNFQFRDVQFTEMERPKVWFHLIFFKGHKSIVALGFGWKSVPKKATAMRETVWLSTGAEQITRTLEFSYECPIVKFRLFRI